MMIARPGSSHGPAQRRPELLGVDPGTSRFRLDPQGPQVLAGPAQPGSALPSPPPSRGSVFCSLFLQPTGLAASCPLWATPTRSLLHVPADSIKGPAQPRWPCHQTATPPGGGVRPASFAFWPPPWGLGERGEPGQSLTRAWRRGDQAHTSVVHSQGRSQRVQQLPQHLLASPPLLSSLQSTAAWGAEGRGCCLSQGDPRPPAGGAGGAPLWRGALRAPSPAGLRLHVTHAAGPASPREAFAGRGKGRLSTPSSRDGQSF